MPQFDHPAFQHLADSLGDVAATSSRSFDLVFDDDLPVTVSMHPNGVDVSVDVWCYDAAMLVGAPRRAVVDSLLLLNRSVQPGQSFSLGLDNRDFIVLHACQAADRLEHGAFGAWLTWLIEQGRRVRELIRTLSLENGLTYSLTGAAQGDQ